MRPPTALLPALTLLAACRPDAPDDKGEATDTAATEPTEGLSTRPVNHTCLARDRPASGGSVSYTQVFSGIDFSFPVSMVHPRGDDSRLWVVEQTGAIRVLDNDDAVSDSEVALDLSGVISEWNGNEDGLLGMDFHPHFADNGYIYVAYTTDVTGGMTDRVSRFHSDDGGATFDPDSEVVLYDIDDRYTNHNGGHVLFGPDGYLYLGMGDGGSAGDPKDNAENPFSMLGKMLRLDVDAGEPYGIPADNPYADGQAGLPEIYAIGLRNPWRYSFDWESGRLWVGDVGQDEW